MLATAIVLIVVGVWLSAMLWDHFEVCRDVLAQVGVRPVVRTCSPPSLGDFAVGWAAVAALMIPEMSEVVIAGVFSFKRHLG